MSKKVKDWFIAAGIRALKTMAQTAGGVFVVGATVEEINIKWVISIAVVAGVSSLLMSINGLPELGSDGDLKITSSEDKDLYSLELDTPLDALTHKKSITLKIQHTNSQK